MSITDHEEKDAEECYEQLDNIITETPKKDVIIVQGDWKTKAGPSVYEHWAGTVGKYGLGETNERGLKLLEFAH